uniref:Uncharacterized protein n=1 Tax=Timema shepardi TaxID=629360 RepID=A0A7R9G707_TIMSH|nr:unnamed protein product [Timema shepardi]
MDVGSLTLRKLQLLQIQENNEHISNECVFVTLSGAEHGRGRVNWGTSGEPKIRFFTSVVAKNPAVINVGGFMAVDRELIRSEWYMNLLGEIMGNHLGKKNHPQYTRPGSNYDLPVIDSLVYCERSALEHAATELAGKLLTYVVILQQFQGFYKVSSGNDSITSNSG